MNVREAMNTPLREVLGMCIIAVFLFQGNLFLAFFRLKKLGKLTALSALILITGGGIMFLLLDGLFHYMEPAYPRTWPWITEKFCSLPVIVLILIEILSIVYIICGFMVLSRFRDSNIIPGSVKETIDLLLAGVAFADEDGKVVLSNITMNEIAFRHTGKVFTDITPFWENASEKQHSVYHDGEKVWQLTREKITENGKNYLQLTATDITVEAGINEELKGKNEKLKEINRRLEIFNRNAEKLIISQELLNARMQIHNETGHILLASRHYMDHPTSIDEKALLQTLKLTNAHLLKEYEEDDTERDPLTEAVEMAGSIGVKVSLNGFIPEGGEQRTILAAAINECATNTKKHADGDLLKVTSEDKENSVIFSLAGNGKVTEKQVTESGGLASLRTLVEKTGGNMSIISSGEFKLVIELPTVKMAPAGDEEN